MWQPEFGPACRWPGRCSMTTAPLRRSGPACSLAVVFALTRVTHSGFAEATLHAAAGLSLTGAARFDKLSRGSGNWTGRGAISWRIAPAGPRLFAQIATGYKRPSLYALGHPLIGNPSLMPETSRNIDAGIELPLPHGQATVTFYDNSFRNLIDFDPVLFRLVNRGHVGARGVEGTLKLGLSGGWSVAGALTYLSLDSATPLRGRPSWNGSVRLLWEKGAWNADLALRGNSDVNDSSIPSGARVTSGHAEADAGF